MISQQGQYFSVEAQKGGPILTTILNIWIVTPSFVHHAVRCAVVAKRYRVPDSARVRMMKGNCLVDVVRSLFAVTW